MQKSGHHQCFTCSPLKQDIGNSNSLPSESAVSWSSNEDRSSSNFLNNTKTPARRFIGSLVSCFVPSDGKPRKEEDQGCSMPADDFSGTSASRASTVSSNSHSKLTRFSGSYSSDDTIQGTREFSITDINKATGNFSIENVIGHGGFGTVYRGKLKDGSLIAVKRAKKVLYQNTYQHLSAEFQSEIQTLSKVEHLNLVRFFGCLECENEQIVVVEYVGNGNLRQHLDKLDGNVLEIGVRLDIAIDIAHAITYLHMYTDHPIIHRDIKSSNILLTENFRAKVADFGFARLAAEDSDATHISTQVKGTAGYLDPEYLKTYQLTEKSDVYSFGVVLVELVTGRNPIERNRNVKERMTTKWAMQKLKEGDPVLVMDPILRRTPASIMVIERVLRLAGECLAVSRRVRPSMRKCAEVLWGIRREFKEMQLSPSSNVITRNAESH